MTTLNFFKLGFSLITMIIGLSGCTSKDVLFPDLANFFLIVLGIGMVYFFEKFRGWSLIFILIILMIIGAWDIVGIILGISAIIFFIALFSPFSIDENIIDDFFTIPEEEDKIIKREEFDSKGEQKLYDIIKELYPDEKIKLHDNPAWLGGNQHIDIHLPKRGIAIEYQGKQHYEPVDYYGGKEAFLRQTELDERKQKKCEKYGVELIYFKYDETISRSLVCNRIEIANPKMRQQRQNIIGSSSQIKAQHKDNVIKVNSMVRLKYLDTNATTTFKIVDYPPGGINLSNGVFKIHKNNPLAKALIGKRIGDTAEINNNDYVEILDILHYSL